MARKAFSTRKNDVIVKDIPLSYVVLTQNNLYAARLLHGFENSCMQAENPLYPCTLRQLQAFFPTSLPLPVLCQALSLLCASEYLFLYIGSGTSQKTEARHISINDEDYLVEAKPVIEANVARRYVFLIDHQRIDWFVEVCDVLLSSERHNLLSKELQRQHKKEYERIRHHISDATQQGLPATLTQFQWIRTLEYCQYQCVFCGGPVHVIEHYHPVSQGGGTTWSNCFPACRSCNVKKGPTHPLQLSRMSLSPRVEDYLHTIQHIETALVQLQQEQDERARQETIQQVRGLDRAIINSFSNNHLINRFLLSPQYTTCTGWMCALGLALLIPAPWWLALHTPASQFWLTFIYWLLFLIACLTGVGAAINPHWRHLLEDVQQSERQRNETTILQLAQAALARQEDIRAQEMQLQSFQQDLQSGYVRQAIHDHFRRTGNLPNTQEVMNMVKRYRSKQGKLLPSEPKKGSSSNRTQTSQ